ncbi:MAG: hypothetical protein AAGF92_21785 [Myxococcota bacterium]
MLTRTTTLALLFALAAWGCSKNDGADGASGAVARGSEVAMPTVDEAVRVWTQPELSLELVAAKLKGVVMSETTSQATMEYEGYQVLLKLSGRMVTRIEFLFDDTKPSVLQLVELYGKPQEVRKGMLFERVLQERFRVRMLAVPVSMPAEDGTLVKSLLIEGGPLR